MPEGENAMLNNVNNFVRPPANLWSNNKNNQAADSNKTTPGFKVDKFDRPQNKTVSGLSAAAQDLLKDLRKKFGNVDFIVANFSTSEEAGRYMGRGRGEFNCVITPDLLEQMANCAETRAEYIGKIEEAIGQVSDLKEALDTSGKADMVSSFGISVGTNGTIEFHAMLADSLPSHVNGGSKTVKAASIEELMKKLDEIDEERRLARNKELRDEKYNIDIEA